MNILVVIPARGGSRGIPLKNIYPIKGKPMLEYAIEGMIESKVNCDIAISTDSDEIATVANKYQQVCIVKRPEDISGDFASTESALIHTLDVMEKKKSIKYDYVITLPVTSPLRKSSTIRKFVEAFDKVKHIYDAQLTLHETYGDYWIKDENDNFSRLYKNAPRRRQERKPMYVENSAIYITSVQSLIETKLVLGKNPTGYIIDEIEGIDINSPFDIQLVESYL